MVAPFRATLGIVQFESVRLEYLLCHHHSGLLRIGLINVIHGDCTKD